MSKFRLFWFDDGSFYTGLLDVESESAAMQAWIDQDIEGDLLWRETGVTLTTRHGQIVMGPRMLGVIEVDDDEGRWAAPTPGGVHAGASPLRRPHRPTVGDAVRQMLLSDPKGRLVIQDGEWFAYAGHIALPEDDDGHDYVTIYLGDRLDT